MKKDKNKTVVTFYKEPYNESETQILAVFRQKKLGLKNLTAYNCYSHIGQHSTANADYLVDKCEPCTEPSEYADLQKELEGLGYNLTITNVVNVIKPTKGKRIQGMELLELQHKKNEEKNIVLGDIRALTESCEQAIDGSWDKSNQGFNSMIQLLERVKQYIENT